MRILCNTRQSIMAADDDMPNFADTPDMESDMDFEDPGADEDFSDESFDDTPDDGFEDESDVEDDYEEEIQEDDVNIEVDNNITGHYIAECDRCHGIFISAVTESDAEVTSINGVCPLCEKESEQFLKWVIKEVE